MRYKLGKTDSAYAPPDRHTLPGIEPGHEQVSSLALSHLGATNDVIDVLLSVLEKHAKVQALRRRCDVDIFTLFGRPFELSFFDPQYEATQQQITQLLGVDKMIAGKAHKY